jgi:hypothetical protein
MGVRCRLGTFTPFPTQLVLHSENHTLDGGDGRFGLMENCWAGLAIGKVRRCWK